MKSTTTPNTNYHLSIVNFAHMSKNTKLPNMKIQIELGISSGKQAWRFARIFRHMNLESCRSHAADDEEAIIFLESIEKILLEVKKDVHSKNLEECKKLMMKKPQLGTPDSDRLEFLADSIEEYETECFGSLGSKSCIKT